MSFFHIKTVSKAAAPIRFADTAKQLGCAACPLNKAVLTNGKMPPSGTKTPLIYILGEAPTWEDDDRGVHMSGNAGQAIRRRLPSKYLKSIRWNNAIRCHPTGHRSPSTHEINCCSKLQTADIEETKPQYVIGFGAAPLRWLFGQSAPLPTWRGKRVAARVGEHSFWYYPMMHPMQIMVAKTDRERESLTKLFDFDFKRLLADIAQELPPPVVESQSKLYRGVTTWWQDKPSLADLRDRIMQLVRSDDKRQPIGFDIETQNLRPYEADSRILTASFSTAVGSYAFPLAHPESPFTEEETLPILRRALIAASWVVCHHTRFETEWMIHRLGLRDTYRIRWEDSMAQAYTLDERIIGGALSLDSLCMQHLGLPLKTFSDVDRAGLWKEPLEKVLKYNALDSKYCRRLFGIQTKLIKQEGLQRVYRMNARRTVAMAAMQTRGVQPNKTALRQFDVELSTQIKEIETRINALSCVEQYTAKHGTFNVRSPKHLSTMFEDVLKVPVRDAYGGIHLDESVLSTIQHPLARLVRKLRPVDKLHSTYILPYISGGSISGDGLIHAFFNNLIVGTGRLSSEDPNLQNFPKRKHREIRRIIKAFTDRHRLVSIDYGQIEARVIAMASKDKTLCNALFTGYDIHSYWAERIAQAYPRRIKGEANLKDKVVMKSFRTDVKNQWTFPAFYLAQLRSISGYLNIPEDVLAPLFEEFWQQFAGVKAWQEKMLANYDRNFYVETLTGRRRHGPLSPSEAVNSPVQGTASDIVVDAEERLIDLAVEEDDIDLVPVMNVHDDLTFCWPKRREDMLIERVSKLMCLSPYKFINVPLTVEVSVGDNWADMEEIAVFSSEQFK